MLALALGLCVAGAASPLLAQSQRETERKLQQMRQDERLRRIPVVMLTSSREESDLARSWDLGVNAYVVKPVDINQFFTAVQTLGRFWAVMNETPGEP